MMVATIQQLQDAGKFTVESWRDVTYVIAEVGKPPEARGGYKDAEYTFLYETDKKELYVKGDVFGVWDQKVLNKKPVEFHLAKGTPQVRVRLDGVTFTIFNPVLRLGE